MWGKSRPARAAEVFLAALERSKAEWAAFVPAECADDPALCRSVFSLLRAHEHTGPLDRLGDQIPDVWEEVVGGGSMAEGDGTGTTESPRLVPGATVGRYEIRERLGAGGMGEAFKAFDSRLHREVAIKVIARRIQDQPEILERFEEEARAASALNHPNIVTVHDIGEQDDFPYIVMELVDGESLREHLAEPLPVDRIVRLGSQLAGALAAAHERGVVHRDLKPENVVVTSKGVAKILDFGVAQFQPVGGDVESLPTLSAEGIVGTVGYMAPEAMTGRSVDHRSDQFALGAILYEMATGQACFRRSSAAETVVATLKEEPELLSGQRSDLPRPLVQLIERCLAKDPGHRYASTWALQKTLSTLPVETPTGRRHGPATLPNTPNRLIGRREELNQIHNLVLEARVRLITLTGPGGGGKTRLAIEAARELQPSFPGGVFFVSLASITDPALVGAAVVQTLGRRESAGGRELPELFVELAAAGGRLLLVLDNFEQVVDAASLVGDLLAGCPELTILVTSREVLRLQAEHDFPVPPLPLPPTGRSLKVEDIEKTPAVTLFAERARAAEPSFAVTAENAAAVAELCARLDGLPLALELAAVRVRTLTPAAMLQRLASRFKLLTEGPRDLPDRQRTLRQAIDWSYGLLEPSEQRVLERLAVFSGGFTLEAAEAVTDTFGHLEREVVELVGSLVDKSLVVRSAEATQEPRFFLLETVREYALEQLAERGDEPAAREAHAAYAVVLAQEAGAEGEAGWQERLREELDNFRVAVEWAVAHDNAAWAVQLIHALMQRWSHGADISEAARWVEQILALPSAQEPTAFRATALWHDASVTWLQGDAERAIGRAREAIAISRQLGHKPRLASLLNSLAVYLVEGGRHEDARAAYEEALGLWREAGNNIQYARTLSNYASMLGEQGDLERARQLYREVAVSLEREGDRAGAAWQVSHEGDAALRQGDTNGAVALYERALGVFREVGDEQGVGSALIDLGNVERLRGALPEARDLYRKALHAFTAARRPRSAGRALEALAVTSEGLGHLEKALLLAGAAASVRRQAGGQTADEMKDALARAVEQARTGLDAAAAAAAWRRGSRMSLDEAVEVAAESGSEATEA